MNVKYMSDYFPYNSNNCIEDLVINKYFVIITGMTDLFMNATYIKIDSKK